MPADRARALEQCVVRDREPLSLRQLTSSVDLDCAVALALRTWPRRHRGRRRSPLRIAERTSVLPSASKPPRMMSDCTGSVSWNSSSRTTSKRPTQPGAARAARDGHGACRAAGKGRRRTSACSGRAPRLHLACARARQAAARGFQLVPAGQWRQQKGVGDVEDLAGVLARLLPREGDRVLPLRELAQVEVSMTSSVRPGTSSTGVTSRSTSPAVPPVGDLQAEAVDCLDGGGVEVGDRLPSRLQRSSCAVARTSASSRTMSSPWGGCRPASTSAKPSKARTKRSRTRSRSSPVAMREGHDEETVDRQVVFRHVARRQRRDGEGLPGPGARLRRRRSPWQRPGDLEQVISSSPPPARGAPSLEPDPLELQRCVPEQAGVPAETRAFGGVEEGAFLGGRSVPSRANISET